MTTSQAALPGRQATWHRTRVSLRPDPAIPNRPWLARCTDCDWIWRSHYPTITHRLARAHTKAHQ